VSKRTVTLKIAGKDYHVRSDGDEAWLHHVASCVDETMATIRDRTGLFDTFDLAMLTCLHLAREVIDHRESEAESGTRVDEAHLKLVTDAAEAALARLPVELLSGRDGDGELGHSGLLPLGDLSEEDAAQGILGTLSE
jgi:cell division protein ZapA (FtsZ GTPase activity inhibitor)